MSEITVINLTTEQPVISVDITAQSPEAAVDMGVIAEIRTPVELDPVFMSSPAANITEEMIVAWNALISFPGFTDLLMDYGFTDNSANWNTAYGWGNHADAGYLTGFTEADPVFASWLSSTPPAYPGDIPDSLADLSDDGTHRTVTDTEKATWNGKQNALGYTPEDHSNLVSVFQETPDDMHYPSEKLVKDALDGKQDAGSYEPSNANIQEHISSTSNPHGVTAAQAGADPSGTAAGAISTHEGAYSHGDIAHTNRSALDLVSGTNTGDQPLDNGTASGQLAFWDGSKWTFADTSELFWDDVNKRLGVGLVTPNSALEVNGDLTISDGGASALRYFMLKRGGVTIGNINTGNSRVQFQDVIGNGYAFLNSSATITAFFKNDGKVGIGTDSPSAALDVRNALWIGSQSGSAGSLVVHRGGSYNAAFSFNGSTGSIGGAGGYVFWQPYNYANADHTFVVAHSTAGDFSWRIGTAASDPTTLTELMRLERAGELKIGSTIKLNPNSASYFTGGNVGIGTYSPLSKLHIKGSGNTSSTHSLTVRNSDDLEILRIRDDGYIGIGTTAPAEKLHLHESTTRNCFQIGTYGCVGSLYSSGRYIFGNNVKPAPSGSSNAVVMVTNAVAGARAFIMGYNDTRSGFDFYAKAGSVTAGDSISLNANLIFRLLDSGKLGLGGIIEPTARLHLPAGTSDANMAPLKLTAGTLMTTPEIGAIEFTDDGTDGHLYITLNIGGVLTRKEIAFV